MRVRRDPGRTSRTGRALALVGALLALGGGAAVTATPASAMTEHVECSITIYNYSPWAMQLYDSSVNGSGGSRQGMIPAGQVQTINADSWFPVHNHCSIDLKYQLQTADGTGWSQAMEAYVYNPNSGHNNAWASMSGDFAQRNPAGSVGGGPFWGAQDSSWSESLEADVCGSSCPAPYSRSVVVGAPPAAAPVAAAPLAPVAAVTKREREPRQVASVLRRGDLPGSGWRTVKEIGDLGRLGDVLEATDVPSTCADEHKAGDPWPVKEGLSAYARRGGAEFVGAGHAVYASERQARRMIGRALSPRSLRCLARVLTSKRFRTTVTTQRDTSTVAGRTVTVNRLKISRRTAGRAARTDYIDLTGVSQGKATALMISASDARRPDARAQAAVLDAVVHRLP